MSTFISVDEARTMISFYKERKEQVLKSEEQGKNILPLNETFEKWQVLTLGVALRVHYGMDAEEKLHAILVGVDETGRDILPPLAGSSGAMALSMESTTDESFILEDGKCCPDDCPPSSDLTTA